MEAWLLTIVQNSANRLLADQSPTVMIWFLIVPLLTTLGGVILTLSLRRWVLSILLMFLLAFFCFLGRPGSTYRIDINRESRVIAWEERKSGVVLSRTEMAAGELAAAEFDFNRDAKNIVLIGKDGVPHYPLGEQHFTGEPQQFAVLTALREVIGQAPLQ